MDALALSEVKYGNIVFDLVLRNGLQLTTVDIEELFGVKPDTPQATDVLKVKSGAGFQLLEINSSSRTGAISIDGDTYIKSL